MDASIGENVSARAKEGPLSHFINDVMAAEEKGYLDGLWGNAVHATGTSFSLHDDPALQEFFRAMRPSWTIPPLERLSGKLLDACYESTMFSTFDVMLGAKSATLGIDGATSPLLLSISNVMAHTAATIRRISSG